MIRVIIIDDETLAQQQIETYIRKVPFMELVGKFRNAADALVGIEELKPDAMFLDINMPRMNGMEMAKRLSNPPFIVFTTAYSEFAVDGFRIGAVDYLLKPIEKDDFLKACDRIRERVEAKSDGKSEMSDYLFCKSDYKVVRMIMSSILYTESMGEYMKIFSSEEQYPNPVLVLITMAGMLEKLPESRFMRVQRSYIVNLERVVEYSRGFLKLDNGTSVPVGDTYRDAVMDFLKSGSSTATSPRRGE